jgi:hypothetical protein
MFLFQILLLRKSGPANFCATLSQSQVNVAAMYSGGR